MSGPPLVRPARAEEEGAVAAVLTDAFVDEAGLNYWLRQGAAKDRARARFFDGGGGGRCASKDGTYGWRRRRARRRARRSGSAPGCHAYDFTPLKQIALTPLLLSIAGVGGMARGLGLASKLAALHPETPHAHLAFLGVATAAQGQGVGSAILKATLAPLDARGVMAFLETTTASNIALYQRHGFEVNGEIEVPGLTIWTMTRAPRG